MKTITTILALAVISIATSVQATIRTVSNNYNSPGQYTSVGTAITASTDGDTLYISGSPFDYGNFTVNKTLTLIGPGHNPAKQTPLKATLGNVTITANGVRLIGLSSAIVTLNASISACIIQRCSISNQVTSYSAGNFIITGVIINGCVFTNTSADIAASGNQSIHYGWTIANNIFNGQITSLRCDGAPSPTSILNNVFIHSTKNTNAFISVYNCIINNNIFWASEAKGAVSGSVMNNNITYSCTSGTFSAAGINNLVNIDPQFVGYSSDANFSYTQDFHLQSTSPGHNSGTDFTDRGVYGGNTNVFSMTGEPAIPEITVFTLSSSTVPPGGSISVNVTSTRIQ